MSVELLLALAAALVAGMASGFAGFGFALVLVPTLLFLYEPSTVIPVNAVLALFTNASVVLDSWREVERRAVLSLLPPALLGLIAGVEILKSVNPLYIRLGVGFVVVFSALLLLRDVRLPGTGGRLGTIVAGSVSGTLATSTGLAGPPVVLLFAARNMPKRSFRVSSAAYFLALSVVGLAILFLRDVAGTNDLPLAAALFPAVLAGKVLGTALMSRIPERPFRMIALGIVALAGFGGAAAAALALL